MPANIIRAQYDDLEQIAARFADQAEAVQQQLLRIKQRVAALEGGGWQGQGIDAFSCEMRGEVFPAVERLHLALTEAQQVTLNVSTTIRAAEEEAERLFKIGDASIAANVSRSSSAGLPGFPPPPPAPETGDGAGPHGAIDRSWVQRQWDRVQKQLWYEVADAADTGGLDNAARHMRHYLSNTGDTLTISPEAMWRDLPGFHSKVEQTAQTDLVEAINNLIASDYNGQPLSFQITTDWQTYYASESESSDWFYASGGFSYSLGAEVTVVPQADGNPMVTVNYQTHVFDRYNWDPEKSVDIGPIHIPDATPGHLHQVGIAHEYEIRGSSQPDSVSYEYTGASGASTVDFPVAGDDRAGERGRVVDDPTRNDDRSRRSGSRSSER